MIKDKLLTRARWYFIVGILGMATKIITATVIWVSWTSDAIGPGFGRRRVSSKLDFRHAGKEFLTPIQRSKVLNFYKICPKTRGQPSVGGSNV